jgi:osmotically-inducible protein OsmY
MKSMLVGFVLLAAGLAAPSPATAQISDQRLGELVADSIRNYARFSIYDDINVGVEDRVVTLFGRVTSPQKKTDIEKRVAKIDGIRALHNEIGVLPVSQVDDRLRVVVATNIYRHPAFWQYAQQSNPPIHVIVEHQHVTLTGEVGSQVDSMLAYSLAQTHGALSITNRIRVARR